MASGIDIACGLMRGSLFITRIALRNSLSGAVNSLGWK